MFNLSRLHYYRQAPFEAFCLGIVAMLFVNASGNLIAQDATGRAFLEQAIARRMQWTVAHVRVRAMRDGAATPAACWNIYMENSKHKGIMTAGECQAVAAGKSPSAPVQVICVNCYEDYSVARYQTPNTPQDAQTGLAIYDSSLLPTNVSWIPDPHVIGVVPASIFIMHGINPQSYYSPDITSDMIISDDTLDGKPAIRLSRYTDATDLDVWIDEVDSRSIIKCTLLSRFDDGDLLDESRTRYSQVNGRWVPLTCEYTRTKGDETLIREIVEMEFLSVDEPLPAKTFDISSFPGLKKGTQVDWIMPPERPAPFSGANLIWDGQAVARRDDITRMPVGNDQGGPVQPRFSRFLIWLNVALISGVILFVACRSWWLPRK